MNKLIFGGSIFLALCSAPVWAINLVGMPGSEEPAPAHPRIQHHKLPRNTSVPASTVDWHPWVNTQNFRYRTGSRYAGSASWERYLELESTTGAVVHFSGISCGKTVANDVALSPATRSIRIKLLSGPLDIWRWDATVLLDH